MQDKIYEVNDKELFAGSGIMWHMTIDPNEDDQHFPNDPIVRFYDTSSENFYNPKEGKYLGQFVSSYYLSTLLESQGNHANTGLCLHGGVESWFISSSGMEIVYKHLENYNKGGKK
jgi:hypothetical protein